MKTSLALFLALAAVLTLSGCAGSAADTDFRSKVQQVDVNGNGTFDPTTKAVGGAVSAQFILRDPTKTGTTK